ncbi:hypothetical protein [Actinoplanes sp. G11-F43]|uniref:hypothetical protein n=1 Tax=Actinoplanes sp. G11-F43 TaxID=3424130 RepID=UPI003D359910
MSDIGQPEQPERSAFEVRNRRLDRRRERIREQLRRDRAGDHKVPTWALALLLLLFIGGWAWLVFSA